MRDQIAEILCDLDEKREDMPIDHDKWADAILAALPDMIAPLVWSALDAGEYGNAFVAIGKNGRHYEAGLDPDGQAYWGFHASMQADSLVSGEIADAKAAANTHHRDAIMAAFKGDVS
jgi:hypothetical protein